jgi:hypothetical protein
MGEFGVRSSAENVTCVDLNDLAGNDVGLLVSLGDR